MEQYKLEKFAFYRKHGAVVKEESQLVHGITSKTVLFEDGKMWCEVYGKCTEKVTTPITVKGLTLNIDLEIDLFRLEYWSTDNSVSKFAYERY